MPVRKVDIQADTIAHVCSICGNEHTFSLADLRVGFQTSIDQINLPVCLCGAQGVLLRPPPGLDIRDYHPHAKMVAGLAKHLVKLGRFAEVARTDTKANTKSDMARGLRAKEAADHDYATEAYNPKGSPDFDNLTELDECNEECEAHSAPIKRVHARPPKPKRSRQKLARPAPSD